MTNNEIRNVNHAHEKNLATVVYALQAASFLLGLTFFVGAAINYMKRDAVRGTWLESHFTYQLKTFWFGLLWAALGLATMFFMIGHAILLFDMLWIVFRVVNGWLRLNDGKKIKYMS